MFPLYCLCKKESISYVDVDELGKYYWNQSTLHARISNHQTYFHIIAIFKLCVKCRTNKIHVQIIISTAKIKKKQQQNSKEKINHITVFNAYMLGHTHTQHYEIKNQITKISEKENRVRAITIYYILNCNML